MIEKAFLTIATLLVLIIINIVTKGEFFYNLKDSLPIFGAILVVVGIFGFWEWALP